MVLHRRKRHRGASLSSSVSFRCALAHAAPEFLEKP
jgi:hypothetical protein